MLSTAEKNTGLPSDFQSSLELTADRVGAGDSPAHAGSTRVGTDAFVRPASEASTPRVGRTLLSDSANSIPNPAQAMQPKTNSMALNPGSGANKNLHCPHPLPSGF